MANGDDQVFVMHVFDVSIWGSIENFLIIEDAIFQASDVIFEMKLLSLVLVISFFLMVSVSPLAMLVVRVLLECGEDKGCTQQCSPYGAPKMHSR